MTRTSTLQSILLDQKKRINLLFSFMVVFSLFHVLVKPFQLSYYATQDFIQAIVAYNLIALCATCLGFIVIPKYLPTIFSKITSSVFNRVSYLTVLLCSIGIGIFIFKITFGYYAFDADRVATGVFAMAAFTIPIGFVAYKADTENIRTKIKELSELTYWKIQKIKTPKLNNDHYEEFYTTTFGLRREDYEDKKVMDIGCGPRGSLEWVPHSTTAVGLDPLANDYLNLHSDSDQLKMQLVEGYSESIPFEDNYFDIVTSFNSLDHVEDLQQSADEIQRVIKPGGLLLLICDVNRKATLTEPHSITPMVLMNYFNNLTLEERKILQTSYKHRIYENVRADKPLQNVNEQGVMIAKFKKR